MRDITLEETVYFNFTTRAFASGVPTVLAGSPALSVLESNNATPITSGVSVSVDRASVVGLNQATVVATAANGYEAGKSYAVYISTGTVGGVSVVGEVVAEFTVQSAAAFTRLGAPAGASVSADIAAVKSQTAAIEVDTGTDLPATLATIAGYLDTEIVAIKTKTDFLPSVAAGAAGGVFIAGSNAATTVNITGNLTGNVSGSVGSVTGAVGSVTGAVGSVTGNVGGNVVGSVASVTAAVAITSNVKKNSARAAVEFMITDSVNHAPATGAAAIVATRSIDSGAFAAGTLSAVTEVSNGIYSIDFGAGDMNGNVVTLRVTSTNNDDTFLTLITQP